MPRRVRADLPTLEALQGMRRRGRRGGGNGRGRRGGGSGAGRRSAGLMGAAATKAGRPSPAGAFLAANAPGVDIGDSSVLEAARYADVQAKRVRGTDRCASRRGLKWGEGIRAGAGSRYPTTC